MRTSGEDLYRIVATYAGHGWHRTGSAVDHATAKWFADELRARGLSISAEPLPFVRWMTESRLTVADREIAHLALHTGWTGQIDTTSVHVAGFDPAYGGFPAVVDAPLGAAQAAHRQAAVLATEHADGALVGINRGKGAGDGPVMPAVLIAGADLATCQADDVRLQMHAWLDAATTTTVVGRTGHRGRPIVLSTPLTGWFGCAGERGSGIAVLLHLVERFAHLPLLVMATGGHELGYFGVERYVDGFDVDAAAVVHIGACVAVEEDAPAGGRRLASSRFAMTTLDPLAGQPVADALEPARLALRCEAERWIGEANAWRRLQRPLLSISGVAADFHTPYDTPERVTSPAALAAAAGAIGNAVEEFLHVVGSDERR